MLGEQVKNDAAENDILNKALSQLEELSKGKKLDKEEKKDLAEEKKDEKVEKCMKCGVAGCKGNCKEKSFAEEAAETENISKALEVSDFLTDLVKSVGAHVDGLKEEINKSASHQAETTNKIAFAMGEIVKSLTSMSTRITELEKTPEVQKSITAKGVERQFAKSGEESEGKKFTRGEICDKLTDMVLKKSMVGGQEVSVHDLNKFESTGQMRDNLKKAIFS